LPLELEIFKRMVDLQRMLETLSAILKDLMVSNNVHAIEFVCSTYAHTTIVCRKIYELLFAIVYKQIALAKSFCSSILLLVVDV
jgi:hypothetical protein